MNGQFGAPAPSHVSVASDKDLERSWKRPNMAASHAREIPKNLSHAMIFLVQDQVRGDTPVIIITRPEPAPVPLVQSTEYRNTRYVPLPIRYFQARKGITLVMD